MGVPRDPGRDCLVHLPEVGEQEIKHLSKGGRSIVRESARNPDSGTTQFKIMEPASLPQAEKLLIRTQSPKSRNSDGNSSRSSHRIA